MVTGNFGLLEKDDNLNLLLLGVMITQLTMIPKRKGAATNYDI